MLRVALPVSCFLASHRARAPAGPRSLWTINTSSARIPWNSSRQLAPGSRATAPKTPLPAGPAPPSSRPLFHSANCSRFMHVRLRQFDALVPASNSWYAVMLTLSLSLFLFLYLSIYLSIYLSLCLSSYPWLFRGEECWFGIFGAECGFQNGCPDISSDDCSGVFSRAFRAFGPEDRWRLNWVFWVRVSWIYSDRWWLKKAADARANESFCEKVEKSRFVSLVKCIWQRMPYFIYNFMHILRRFCVF